MQQELEHSSQRDPTGAWARCWPGPGSGARAGAAAGMPSRVVVSEVCSFICPLAMHSWFCPTLPRCSGLSFAVVWGGGCGTQSLAWSMPWAACLLFVAEDRHKPAEIPVLHSSTFVTVQHSGEVLAVLHTGATWTALPRTGCGTWVSCSGAAQASASGPEILSATSSPCVAQGKA